MNNPAAAAVQTSKSVKDATVAKTQEIELQLMIKLEALREQFKDMINKPVSVKDLGALALSTVKYLGRVAVHYTARATIGLAKLVKGFANLLMSICFVAAMIVVDAAKAVGTGVVNVFTRIYTWASDLVSRDGKADASDIATADQLQTQLSTVKA